MIGILKYYMAVFNFTPRAQQVMTVANTEASKHNNPQVTSAHLLIGLLLLRQSIGRTELEKQNIDVDLLIGQIREGLSMANENALKSEAKGPGGKIPLSSNVNSILSAAKSIAKKLDHSFIGTEHILLGILINTSCQAFQFLEILGVNISHYTNSIKTELNPQNMVPSGPEHIEDIAGTTQSALETYGTNLTALAAKDKLDPVIHRDEEIDRLIQVLSRRTKNNPVLIGEPGVGKTAIVEGLALKLVNNDVPINLKNKHIIAIDMPLMLAGTKYRGQFEERLKQVMTEIRGNTNIIIFIDEIHTLIGAGNSEGAMDAANILKPALARGEVRCIGATTFDEYRNIESDGALERRFQTITVLEPTADMTLEIIHGIKYKYEDFHNVSYTDNAVHEIIKLTNRYVTDRHFPDKAIDILDEAGAMVRIKNNKVPKKIKEKELKISLARTNKRGAMQEEEFELAAKYRTQEKRYSLQRDKMLSEWDMNATETLTVNSEHIKTAVSSWVNIPVHTLDQDDIEKLLSLESIISNIVIGQDESVRLICDSIKRGRTCVGDPNKPQGSFLFLGPTGVGKTYLAKQLANSIFDSEDNIIQFDMSEMMEEHSISKFIGSPPGYVGYGEGGQLTEIVRRNPYSVVLLDEIEKAHPSVTQLLLQILEEGKLTDSLGVTVNFKNCIIIMSSNIGAQKLQHNSTVGFGTDVNNAKDGVLKEVKNFFTPEFLNRLDEIIIFNPLNEENIAVILKKELQKVKSRLLEQNVHLTFNQSIRALLLKDGFDVKLGARPLKRAIQKYVETPLANYLLLLTSRDKDQKLKLKVSYKKDITQFT